MKGIYQVEKWLLRKLYWKQWYWSPFCLELLLFSTPALPVGDFSPGRASWESQQLPLIESTLTCFGGEHRKVPCPVSNSSDLGKWMWTPLAQLGWGYLLVWRKQWNKISPVMAWRSGRRKPQGALVSSPWLCLGDATVSTHPDLPGNCMSAQEGMAENRG